MNNANFTLFRERLVEACRLRNTTPDKLARSIGLGSRRAIDLEYLGLKCLDIYRLAQIADRLDVSIDWLLGRTGVMALPGPPERLVSWHPKVRLDGHLTLPVAKAAVIATSAILMPVRSDKSFYKPARRVVNSHDDLRSACKTILQKK